MKILCITHADFESPGIIESWAKNLNYNFKISRPYKNEPLTKDFDILIIMGGPQSPIEIENDPYLKDEIALIKEAIANDKIILGFCLGAQLIGEAVGANTTKSPEKEIGVFPIKLTEAAKSDPLLFDFPDSFPVIHWHNDMPGETELSVVLAYSSGCPRQIVRYGKKLYGFQCHLEITLDGIEDMIQNCEQDLKPGRFIQTVENLRKQDYDTINKLMLKILDRMVKL